MWTPPPWILGVHWQERLQATGHYYLLLDGPTMHKDLHRNFYNSNDHHNNLYLTKDRRRRPAVPRSTRRRVLTRTPRWISLRHRTNIYKSCLLSPHSFPRDLHEQTMVAAHDPEATASQTCATSSPSSPQQCADQPLPQNNDVDVTHEEEFDEEWIQIVEEDEEGETPAPEDEDDWISDVSDTEEEERKHRSRRQKTKTKLGVTPKSARLGTEASTCGTKQKV